MIAFQRQYTLKCELHEMFIENVSRPTFVPTMIDAMIITMFDFCIYAYYD